MTTLGCFLFKRPRDLDTGSYREKKEDVSAESLRHVDDLLIFVPWDAGPQWLLVHWDTLHPRTGHPFPSFHSLSVWEATSVLVKKAGRIWRRPCMGTPDFRETSTSLERTRDPGHPSYLRLFRSHRVSGFRTTSTGRDRTLSTNTRREGLRC